MRKTISLLVSLIFLFSTCCALGEAAKNLEADYGLVPSGTVTIPVFTEENMKQFDIPDNDAMRFMRQLQVGWNLGNTFDAFDDNNPKLGLKLESYWTNAVTSRELIHALKDAGFNLIRIPVSWHNHLIDENYTVDPSWMARIHEVAEWIAAEGMYFIINVHHDNGVRYFYPDTAHYEQSERYLSAIWNQIADSFADFDEHCILESMNEPRLVGSSHEWWLDANAAECRDAAECINKLNQAFVSLVRAKGGNNAERYLSVPGYCASPDGVLYSGFTIPEDSAENRIIIEVHAYTPYNFALNKNSSDSSFDLEKDKDKKSEISRFMNNLYQKYIANGVPVIIDEFGALKKKDDDLQARVNFTAFYIASASARGITCCWWDNHGFSPSGERFGIINRNKIVWVYPDIALALIQNSLFNRESE